MPNNEVRGRLTKAERATLTERSDAKGLLHLAGHGGALGLTGALLALKVPLWPVLMIIHGVLATFLFTLLHETVHNTPFKSAWLNRVVGHGCGFILFIPAGWFLFFHLAHHRHTQIPGKDPELTTPKPSTTIGFAWHVTGIATWFGIGRVLAKNAWDRNDDDYLPTAHRRRITTEARLYLVGYGVLLAASIAAGSTLLVFVWLVPLVLGQPFLRIYLLAEHGQCPFVANMLQNTRTTLTNRFVRALAWNMPYHAEHHSYPAVPFHQLPRLHERLEPHLEVVSSGYVSFAASYMRPNNKREPI